jgi:Plasmid pRiA4b ORF-3-like protein
MGWENYHLHEFRSRGIRYGTPDPEEPRIPRVHDETTVSIGKLLHAAGDTLSYEYDFGDSWLHALMLEDISSAETGIIYPTCIAGERACPLEDAGGLPGFYRYLEAISDPAHEEHQDLIDWRGPGYNAEAFSVAKLNGLLQRRPRSVRAGPA